MGKAPDRCCPIFLGITCCLSACPGPSYSPAGDLSDDAGDFYAGLMRGNAATLPIYFLGGTTARSRAACTHPPAPTSPAGRGCCVAPLAMLRKLLPLPPGFACPVLSAPASAVNSKNTFCMLRDGAAIPSPHLGDLAGRFDPRRIIRKGSRTSAISSTSPLVGVARDLHPDYSSSQLARAEARKPDWRCSPPNTITPTSLPVSPTRYSREAAPVIGVALDGMGYGEDGNLRADNFETR